MTPSFLPDFLGDSSLEPLAAIKSMTRLVRNPTHTHEVFTIIKALSGSDLQKGLDRFKGTEFGEKVLSYPPVA